MPQISLDATLPWFTSHPSPGWQSKVWQWPPARNAPYNLNQPTNQEPLPAPTVAANICTTKEGESIHRPAPFLRSPSTPTPPQLPLCFAPPPRSPPPARVTLLSFVHWTSERTRAPSYRGCVMNDHNHISVTQQSQLLCYQQVIHTSWKKNKQLDTFLWGYY